MRNPRTIEELLIGLVPKRALPALVPCSSDDPAVIVLAEEVHDHLFSVGSLNVALQALMTGTATDF